ncbi:MAG: hypothetical protein EOM20_07115, partial [Spartobacteria bacterium]|nr:hypothetical protein [Spartobacteria bacterium]
LEPEPNASPLHASNRGMRNLGAYGGTEQGSLTPSNRRLRLYAPLGGDIYVNQAVTLRWTWAGTNWQGADTVALEYSANSGETWIGIAGASAVTATAGQYAWDISGLMPGLFYRVRATCNQDAAATDASPDDFRIGGTLIYYVNDVSTNLDAWCTASGNDANDGLTPSTPKATVQAVLDAYDLKPGDMVRIDTGDYLLSENVEVTAQDQGATGNPVVFEASPYGVTFDRGSTASGSYGWHISGASNVTLRTAVSAAHPGAAQRWMRVTGGYDGIFVAGTYCRLERVDAAENLCRGIYIDGTYATVENCLARGSTDSYVGVGIFVGSRDTTVNNCTIADNAKYGVYIGSSDSTLRNNIICADGTGDYAIYAAWQTPNSDYNCFHAANGALVGNSGGDRTTLAEWRMATGGDANSLSCDPGFVNTAGEDFHLESTRGSYHGGAWSADGADSPGLDTGYGDAGLEPEPNASPLHASNRGMRNLGAYGGTEQGSLTPSNRRLRLYAPRGGDIYVNQAIPVTIRWTWAGTNWQGADTVALEYSANAGGTWNGIAGASAVVATDGQYAWDISGLTPGPLYRVRATCNQDASAIDASPDYFRIGGTLTFYVNDTSINLNAWCTAPGNDANDGLTPATPKATVQAVLDAYDLEPGDMLRIDTGDYGLNANIGVASQDQGATGNPVIFEASPYGVTFNRNSTAWGSYGWHISGASYVTLRTAVSAAHPNVAQRWMRVTGGYAGIYVEGTYCRLERVEVAASLCRGIDIRGTYATVENCLARGSTDTSSGAGIYVRSSYATVNNCTIAGNAKYGVYISSSSGTTLRNNIICADGTGDYAIYRSTTNYTLNSDYNGFHAANGALVGYSGGDRATLTDWRTATSKDANSLSLDPLFADAVGGDYHLRSVQGRYAPGTWVADTEHSPCIDAGDPNDDWTDESAPNGDRINFGAYGGTEQASRSLTNATRTILIVSEYSTATPPAGTYTNNNGASLTCSVNTQDIISGSTQLVHKGWTLEGVTDTNGLSSGSASAICFVLTNDAVLTWLRQTNYWLGLVIEGQGAVNRDSGWHSTGTNITLYATPSNGWSFAGWIGDQPPMTTNVNPVTLTMEGPCTVQAIFTANTYTVTFDAQGGETPDPETALVTFGTPYGMLPNATHPEYTLDGWWTATNGGTRVTDATLVTTAADHSLFARWIQHLTALRGIPIAWYIEQNISPSDYGMETWEELDEFDSDGDGMPNWKEYVADTDPQDPSSLFRVMGSLQGEHPELCFESSTGTVYTLWGRSNLLSGIWSPVPGAGPRMGVGGTDYVRDTNDPPRGPIYRLQVERP